MKKLLSLVLCALLLLTPVLGAAAEEDASLLDQLWAMSDCSYLVDWGVLTEAEAIGGWLDAHQMQCGEALAGEESPRTKAARRNAAPEKGVRAASSGSGERDNVNIGAKHSKF